MTLNATLAVVGRVRPDGLAAQRRFRLAAIQALKQTNLSALHMQFRQAQHPQLMEHARRRPALEPLVRGRGRA